jgi:DNA polymerase III delta subunit
MVKSLLFKGTAQSQLAGQIGVPPFVIQKLIYQSKGFSGKQLEAALLRLAKADIELKSSRLHSGLILENALLDLSFKADL